jgi:pyruvate/2-oxoglutarate dehydrogenase complex dihydrolipoamide acyltransferase (E2) component
MSTTNFNTDWRKTAAALYRKPTDSKVFGTVELDVTELEQFIADKRRQGLKITLTHIFLLAIARAYREAAPELNCYVRMGRIVSRPSVDASLSVLIKNGTEMGSVKVPDADRLTLTDLAAWLDAELARSRRGNESAAMSNKSMLARIPWPFRNWVVRWVRLITIDWGFSIPILGITPHTFGSFLLTNNGSVGIDLGYPALLPLSNVSAVVAMGFPQTKPAVIDGQVVPRRLLTLSAVMDHRVVDAVHAGRIFRFVKKIVREPELLEQQPG